MDITQVQSLVGSLGFPVFVAGFMLLKQSKDMEAMTAILTKLQTTIEQLAVKSNDK
jgi:hypothetical protein